MVQSESIHFRKISSNKNYITGHKKAPKNCFKTYLKPVFHLANLFARTEKKVGTVPTCSRRIFSPTNFNQSRCRILVFASRRANKFAKWKTGLKHGKHLILELGNT